MEQAQQIAREDGEKAYHRYVAATEASTSLKRHIQTLAALIPRGHASTDEHVADIIRTCEKTIEAEEAANLELLDHIPPVHRKPTEAAHVAAKVFAMPEILEHILTYLSVPELLGVYGVSKAFYDIIEGSVKLQRLLGLKPDPDSHYLIPAESLILRTHGVKTSNSIHMLPWGMHDIENCEFKVVLDITSKTTVSAQVKLPRLGVRCARMLLSQPPAKEVRIYAHCCTCPPFWVIGSSSARDPPTTTMQSDNGITMGEVYETAERVRREHLRCVHSDWRDYDEEGLVHSNISVQGVLSLKDNDPLLPEKDRRQRENSATRRHREKMLKYNWAKEDARNLGHPLPSLAEYEAAQQDGGS